MPLPPPSQRSSLFDFLVAGELVLSLSTLAIAFLILVFSEIAPKVIGASYPERVALSRSYVLTPLLKVIGPWSGSSICSSVCCCGSFARSLWVQTRLTR